jgi:hypothetical protein
MLWSPDELSLLEAINSFSQRIIKVITDDCKGGNSADLGEAFPTTNGPELVASIRVTPQSGRMLPPGPPRHPGRVENDFSSHTRGNSPTDGGSGIGIDDGTRQGDACRGPIERQVRHQELVRAVDDNTHFIRSRCLTAVGSSFVVSPWSVLPLQYPEIT